MTPDFDPTSVDWNNPDVEYIMKHVKMAMTNRDDENEVLKKTIGELTDANSELTDANSELTDANNEILDHVKELQSKYDKLAEAYRLLEGGSGTVPDVDKHKEKDPSKRRSYNVREYNGYPRTNAQDRKMVPVREVVIRRTAIADDSHCRTCGYMLSGITDRHDKVTEDVHGGKMLGTSWKVTRRYCRVCGRQQTSLPAGVLPGEHYGIVIMSQAITLGCKINSFEDVRDILGMFYNVLIPRSTLNHFSDTVADRLEPLYNKLKAGLVEYDCIGGDDTGWFVCGKKWQAWTFVGQKKRAPHTVVFEIVQSRGMDVTQGMLGEKYDGLILSDSHGSWNHVGGRHQKCLLHYFRDMYRTLNTNSSSEFALFFMELYCILKDAIGIGRRDPEEAEMLRSRVTDLIFREYQDPDCLRYVKRLKREIGHLFTFLECDVDYHNNISERSVRVFAKARKVLYGSRTERGAHRTKILMSVYATCKARDVNFYEFLMDYLSGKVKAIPSGPPLPVAETSAA